MSDEKRQAMYSILRSERRDQARESEPLRENARQMTDHIVEVDRGLFEANPQCVVDAAHVIAEVYRRNACTGKFSAADISRMPPTDTNLRIRETPVATLHILWDLVHTLLADDREAPGVGKRRLSR